MSAATKQAVNSSKSNLQAPQIIHRNGDKLMVCPFDKNHVMLASRYETHYRRCAMRSDLLPDTCPFNAKHQVGKGELRHHMETCQDRHRLEKDIIHLNSMAAAANNVDEATDENENLLQIEESFKRVEILKQANNENDWDDEIDKSVNPNLAYKPDKYTYTNKTKAARKQMRKEALDLFLSKKNAENNNDYASASHAFDFTNRDLTLSSINGFNEYEETSVLQQMNSSIKTSSFRDMGLGRGYIKRESLSSKASSIKSNTTACNDEVVDDVDEKCNDDDDDNYDSASYKTYSTTYLRAEDRRTISKFDRKFQ